MSDVELQVLKAEVDNQKVLITDIKQVLNEVLKELKSITLSLTKVDFLNKKDYEQDLRLSKLEAEISQLKVWKTVTIVLVVVGIVLVTGDFETLKNLI